MGRRPADHNGVKRSRAHPGAAAASPWRWLGLAGWLLLCFGAAAMGSRYPPGAWYDSLEKPPWTPPDAIFAPVWTVLYAMMAVAGWLVWKERGFRGAPAALGLFLLQLLANFLWSYLFFGLEMTDVALLDIAVLWLAIAATASAFWPVRKLAAVLLLPYLLWVSFAAALNFEIWRLN
jgi:tryptophan-rich sensory protein